MRLRILGNIQSFFVEVVIWKSKNTYLMTRKKS